VTGGLAGAVVAPFLAPQSGSESREQVRRYARQAEEHVHELADTATRVLDRAVDKGCGFIKDKQAVEAGHTAMQRERERLSGDRRRDGNLEIVSGLEVHPKLLMNSGLPCPCGRASFPNVVLHELT
jgi:gas vesicle protein